MSTYTVHAGGIATFANVRGPQVSLIMLKCMFRQRYKCLTYTSNTIGQPFLIGISTHSLPTGVINNTQRHTLACYRNLSISVKQYDAQLVTHIYTHTHNGYNNAILKLTIVTLKAMALMLEKV